MFFAFKYILAEISSEYIFKSVILAIAITRAPGPDPTSMQIPFLIPHLSTI